MNTRKRASVLLLSDLRKLRQDDEDLWPISLADMMTLLLCFFLLIVAVSHVDLNRYERVADSMQKAMVTDKTAPKQPTEKPKPAATKTTQPEPQAPAHFKVSRTTLSAEPAPTKTPTAPTTPVEQTAQPKPEPAPQVQPTPQQTQAKPEPAPEKPAPERTGPTKKSLDDIRKELASKLDITSGAVELTPRENGVELNLRGAAFFDSASADIKPGGIGLLREIATTLSGTPYKVTVEGHTDNNPIESWLYPSNWELSSARASRVARFLIDNGVPRNRLRVEGLADTQPVAPNEDPSGKPLPENQAKNRRVVILVSP